MSLAPKPPASLSLPASAAAPTPAVSAAGVAAGSGHATLLSLLGAAGKTLVMSKAFLLASLLSVSSILAYEQMDGEGLGAGSPGGSGDAADGGNLATLGGRGGGASGDDDGDGSNATDDRWGDVRDGKRTWYPKLGGNRGGGLGAGGGGGGEGDGGSGSGDDDNGTTTDPDPEEPDEPSLLPAPLAHFLRSLKDGD